MMLSHHSLAWSNYLHLRRRDCIGHVVWVAFHIDLRHSIRLAFLLFFLPTQAHPELYRSWVQCFLPRLALQEALLRLSACSSTQTFFSIQAIG